MVELAAARLQQDASADAAALRNYYLVRAGVSAAWIAAVLSIGRASPLAAALLLVAYPAWDALANLADAARSGGLRRNPTQAFNTIVSAATAAGVALSLGNMHTVLAIFGVWAAGAGLLQLATGVRRWKRVGAQWAMILSGAQSTLAGGHFLFLSFDATTPNLLNPVPLAGYAGFGAFYFLVSAIALTFRRR